MKLAARSCVPWQAGQDHVFSFYDELSPEEQRDLDDQFDRINAQDRISVGTALEFLSAVQKFLHPFNP